MPGHCRWTPPGGLSVFIPRLGSKFTSSEFLHVILVDHAAVALGLTHFLYVTMETLVTTQ